MRKQSPLEVVPKLYAVPKWRSGDGFTVVNKRDF